MRTFRFWFGLLIFLASFVCGSSCRVFAMAGTLQGPSLSLPEKTPTSFRTKVLDALRAPGCKFLEGSFLNASTTMHFAGNAEALEKLISALQNVGGVRVVLSFGKTRPEESFTVRHNGWADPGEIFIEINVSSSTLKLEQLSIPVGPPATPAARSP